MKISFVIQDLFSLGAQYVTALLVRGFIAKGYQVDLIVSQIHNEKIQSGFNSFEVPENVRWIFLPYRKARKNVWALRKYLKGTDSQAVISMSSNYAQALSVAKWLTFSKAKIYNVEHNGGIGVSLDGKNIIHGSRKFSLVWCRNWFFTRPFEKILTVSTGNADAIARMFNYPRDRIEVVYNPVIDEVFYKKVNDKSNVHPWLKEKTCPTFVAAGAHAGLKNHMLLLNAFKIANKHIRVRLILFGNGDLTENYRSFILDNKLEDCVTLAGYTDNLPANLSCSDGLIVSSNVESFSVVLVEALACGVPVISTDCPYGPREILDNGKYGTIVPIDDVDSMANAIIGLSKENGLKSYPDFIWKRFSVDAIVERYEKALGFRRS